MEARLHRDRAVEDVLADAALQELLDVGVGVAVAAARAGGGGAGGGGSRGRRRLRAGGHEDKARAGLAVLVGGCAAEPELVAVVEQGLHRLGETRPVDPSAVGRHVLNRRAGRAVREPRVLAADAGAADREGARFATAHSVHGIYECDPVRAINREQDAPRTRRRGLGRRLVLGICRLGIILDDLRSFQVGHSA